MSELISSTTPLCSAPEPQQFVLHFILFLRILWMSLTEEIDSDSLLGQMTRHHQISKPLYLCKSRRGKGTAQDSLTVHLVSFSLKTFPGEFIMLIMGDRLSHQEGIISLKFQSRLNLLGSNAKYFICKPSSFLT